MSEGVINMMGMFGRWLIRPMPELNDRLSVQHMGKQVADLVQIHLRVAERSWFVGERELQIHPQR